MDLESLRGQQCVIGLDLSEVQDMTCMVAYFPKSGAVLCWAWAPAPVVRGNSMVPYEAWEAEGWLSVTQARDRQAPRRPATD